VIRVKVDAKGSCLAPPLTEDEHHQIETELQNAVHAPLAAERLIRLMAEIHRLRNCSGPA
jgi:hypothetical protein